MRRSHGCVVIPRQEIVYLALFVAVDDGSKDAGDVCMRFHGVQFTGFDQRGQHGPVLGTCFVTCEQGVFAAQGDGTDCSFDRIIVDLDAAVSDELI